MSKEQKYYYSTNLYTISLESKEKYAYYYSNILVFNIISIVNTIFKT